MDINLTIWENLLKGTTWLDPPNRLTEQEFHSVTKPYSFNIPSGYKEFYLTFGRCSFVDSIGGDYLDMYLNDFDLSITYLSFLRDSLERLIRDYPNEDFTFYKTLLGNCFNFAGSSDAQFYLWDLKSYSPKDNSYDIYLVRIDSPDIFLVGRDFFTFVKDYCLGNKLHMSLPEGEIQMRIAGITSLKPW
jgi:hypothetical protein